MDSANTTIEQERYFCDHTSITPGCACCARILYNELWKHSSLPRGWIIHEGKEGEWDEEGNFITKEEIWYMVDEEMDGCRFDGFE